MLSETFDILQLNSLKQEKQFSSALRVSILYKLCAVRYQTVLMNCKNIDSFCQFLWEFDNDYSNSSEEDKRIRSIS